jgi:protein associated with RNAse G/E
MGKIKIGDKYQIQCYKHNGKIHRAWDEAIVLDVKDDYIVLADENVLITKEDGRVWHTKGSAILFFYRKRWFNIIAQIKDDGTFYYCNIASPFIIENHILKYIDYDLDLRVFSDGAFKILDRNEYNYHKKLMNYPKEINFIIKEELSSLIEMKKSGVFPFNKESIEYYRDLFKKVKKERK